jgi:hypothetical protein
LNPNQITILNSTFDVVQTINDIQMTKNSLGGYILSFLMNEERDTATFVGGGGLY